MVLYLKSVFFRYALAYIHKAIKVDHQNADENDGLCVYRINKLFINAEIPVLEDYVSRVQKLRGEISLVDFENNANKSRQYINDYVEDRMNGRVSDCFAPGTIDRSAQVVLANGICFRARYAWVNYCAA